MHRLLIGFPGVLVIGLAVLSGCTVFKKNHTVSTGVDGQHYETAATRIEYTDVEDSPDESLSATPPPVLSGLDDPEKFWDLTLEEAVQQALANSKVMRDLGGLVLRAPDNSATVHDPAIQETDPRFGVEAALSAFDTSFAAGTFVEWDDFPLNNSFFGGGTRVVKQDVGNFQAELSKIAATGTELSFRNATEYNKNNAPGNAFPSVWTTRFEAEIRHPLLLGGGIDFNRIAGPGSVPGVYNGVLIARTNTDVSLAEFELAVRNFISDVENAYWDLYFAYRDLDAKITARDAALKTWRAVHALYEANRRGGEAHNEAQAREQYFRFQEDVENALYGRLLEGTRTNNGSSAGTFRGTGGVYVAERRLRLLMGVPIGDGRVIRPEDEPSTAKITFDWDECLLEALTRRAELRRETWRVKRREMELEASRKFLLPSLDTTAQYRIRGLGKDLFRQHDVQFNAAGEPVERQHENNAFGSLNSGDFQEWQVGLELSLPIGFRRAHAAVRNAELRLARERAILHEQERQIVHDLSDAFGEQSRAYATMSTDLNRLKAAREQVQAVQAAYEADQAQLNLVLEAQRFLADAESTYYRSLVEYAMAIKHVHFEKGSLLDYNEIYLEEGDWPNQAYRDAAERAALRSRPLWLPHFLSGPKVISEGLYPQQMVPRAASVSDGEPGGSSEPERQRRLAPTPDEVPNYGADASAKEPVTSDE